MSSDGLGVRGRVSLEGLCSGEEASGQQSFQKAVAKVRAEETRRVETRRQLEDDLDVLEVDALDKLFDPVPRRLRAIDGEGRPDPDIAHDIRCAVINSEDKFDPFQVSIRGREDVQQADGGPRVLDVQRAEKSSDVLRDDVDRGADDVHRRAKLAALG